MAQKTGFGTVVTFGTTTTYAPKRMSVSGPSMSREFHNSSHLQTTGGFHTYIADDLVEGGEISMEVFWDPADTWPPIEAAVEVITITHNDTGAATEILTGGVSGFDKAIALGALMMATVTIKVCGEINFTA